MFKNLIKQIKKEASSDTLVLEIHNEFDSASEKLLPEAKDILSKGFDADKSDRLKALGFTKSKTVTEMMKVKEEQAAKKQLAESIEYFQVNYPSYKFINEETVRKICEKYNLLFGDSSDYIGDIPEKNLAEIENFKLKEEDMVPEYTYIDWSFDQMQQMPWGRQQQTQQRDLISRLGYLGGIDPYRKSGPSEYTTEPEKPAKVKPAFKIVAPEKDFDMRYMEKVGHKIVPKDPIVLQPVKGGYLIVTKWGIEGADESLTNELMN